MKGASFYLIFFIVIVVIVIPGVMVKSCQPMFSESPNEQEITREIPEDKLITLYLSSSKKLMNLSLDEYVKGVVAAEMPASFAMEAIKAQAVAARTYVYKRWRAAGSKGCSLHPGADVCDDPTHCQAWINKSEMLTKWGIFSYYHYFSKINQAVNSTTDMVIFFQDEPIDPLYFSTSNGKTENSEDVWETSIPYLRSVVSPDEETSPRFFEVKQFDVETVVSLLRQKWSELSIDHKNPEKQWSVLEISEGGRIKKMQIGNIEIKGTEFRQLFGLNSTDIKWERSDQNIRIMSTGFGHGVGLSQYGANAMAKKGDSYVDIVKHYYTGVEVRRMKK